MPQTLNHLTNVLCFSHRNHNVCSHSQITMSVLGQISSVTAYVLKWLSFLYSYLFSSQYTNFPGENMLPSILCPIQAVFQEKAQVTMPTFLERTCAPSHNTYCRSCLSSCSINIIILTAQEFTLFQELFMVISRDNCYSSHSILNTMYYDPPPPLPLPTENKTKQKKTKQNKKKSFLLLLYHVLSENEPKSALFSSVLMHTSFLFCTITLFPVIKSSVATVLLSCMVSTGQPSP